MAKKRILFYVHVSSHLKAFLKLILRLRESVEFEPVVLLNSGGGWNLMKEVKWCKEHQIEYILDAESEKVFKEDTKLSTEAPENPYYVPADTVNSKGVKVLIKNVLKRHLSFLTLGYYFRKRIKEFSTIIASNRAHLVVLPEDNVGDLASFVRAAKKLGRQSVLIPWAKANHEDVIQLSNYKVHGFRTLFCKLFPKWKMTFQGEEVMPLSVVEILVMSALRIAPNQPFSRFGGRSDVLFVENDDDLKYYSEVGIPAAKMIKTGAAYQDVFFEAVNNKQILYGQLCAKYGIVDERPIILCNLFPVATAVDVEYVGFEYSSVREAISFWLDPLIAAKNFQLWVNHHPRTTLEFVRYLELLDLKVIYEPIEDILPFCDLYVTGVSSTTRMALSLAKPIICHTEFYIYTDLDNFKSAIPVKKSEYATIVKKVTEDDEYFRKLQIEALHDAKNFGPLDGKSFERICKTLNSLTEKSIS